MESPPKKRRKALESPIRLRGFSKLHRVDLESAFDHMSSYRRLKGHNSCVNALAYSRGLGKWLASGGDDSNILLWDMYGDFNEGIAGCFKGPSHNIFTIAFNSTNSSIISGGTDSRVFVTDFARATESGNPTHANINNPVPPKAQVSMNDDCVREIDPHPSNPNLFLNACGDNLYLHDLRDISRRPVGKTMRWAAECSSVKFHPGANDLFAAADELGHVRLLDLRNAFHSSSTSRPLGNDHAVRNYATRVCKAGMMRLAVPEVSSITFDGDGSRLGVTFLRHLPTIYATDDPYPLATCSAETLPDGQPIPEGERSYLNQCTIKHGSFTRTGSHYVAGSDDFRGYIWRLPSEERLKDARRDMGKSDWEAKRPLLGYVHPDGGPMIPLKIMTPTCRLSGHRSIVNTTLVHPELPLIATAGIENDVLIHSALTSEPSSSHFRTYTPTRRLPQVVEESERRQMLRMMIMDDPVDSQSESRTILMFDELLREESGRDIFQMRTVGDEDSDEDSSEGEEDSDEFSDDSDML